jgi:hypothetical protein
MAGILAIIAVHTVKQLAALVITTRQPLVVANMRAVRHSLQALAERRSGLRHFSITVAQGAVDDVELVLFVIIVNLLACLVRIRLMREMGSAPQLRA